MVSPIFVAYQCCWLYTLDILWNPQRLLKLRFIFRNFLLKKVGHCCTKPPHILTIRILMKPWLGDKGTIHETMLINEKSSSLKYSSTNATREKKKFT